MPPRAWTESYPLRPHASIIGLIPYPLFCPLTFDNGKEFAEHEALAAATGMTIFFAQPYCSWQRGTNGLLRQYLPKGTDLTAYSHHEVAAIQSSLNDRPRKRLGYLTPREVLPTTPPATVLHLEFETADHHI